LGLPFARVANAAPFVHQLFCSDMVLQRDAADPIWGWGSPGVAVTVKVYDQNAALIQTTAAVADSSGRWQTTVGPFGLVTNNSAYSITISAPGQTTVTLTDVLIGDVWLCSGQSNMQWALSGDYNASAEIADSINYPQVRHFTVPDVSSHSLQTNIPSGNWLVANPQNSGGFSAIAYIMAREIYKQQGIPVGIIHSSWGGTLINAWCEPGFVSTIADYTQRAFDQAAQPASQDFASCLYSAMIYPLAPFRIKAVTWYQGEFDASTPDQYGRMLPGLMSSWRTLFGQPNLPFIIVQLPNPDPQEANNWALMREAQTKSVAADSNSRIVVTLDVGADMLHSPDKQDMGLRASWAAANLVYGNHVVDQSPSLSGFSISGTNVICTFSNLGGGLMVGMDKDYTNPITPTQPLVGGTLTGFALSGADGVLCNANAFITSSNTIVVSSPNVVSPVNVRYAFVLDPICNLYGEVTNGSGTIADGLPAGSFRSDSAVYYVSVNNGSGAGYYSYGTHPIITASGNPAGEVFDHWSGDTNLINNISNPSTTVIVSQPYISVLANYRITGAPSGLAAVPQPGQVTLSWNSMTWVHYNVKRSTVSGGPYITTAANLYNTNSFVDTNAAEGTIFYYVVSATNLLGEGPNSAAINTVTTGDLVINRSGWVASASVGSSPANAIDGDSTTRWTTGISQTNGQWFQVDMRTTNTFYKIVLDAGSSGGYPQGYQVNVSNDGINWGSPVATGSGSSGLTTIVFPSQTARYIRITQTGTSATAWSIYELYVYASALMPTGLTAVAGNSLVNLTWSAASGASSYNVKRATNSGGSYVIVTSPAATNYSDAGLLNDRRYYYVVSALNAGGESSNSTEAAAMPTGTNALNRTGWVATASVSAGGNPPSNAIDGDITTRWSTGTSQANGQWFQVDMGITNAFTQIILDATPSPGDYPQGYQVYVSNDGNVWNGPVATGAGSSAVTTINFALQTARYIQITQTGSSGGWWSIHEFNVYGGASALSQINYYTNNAAGNWSSVAWQPGIPSSGNQTAFVFANHAVINSTNDLGGFTVNQMVFASQTVNLAGNPVVFDGVTPLVTNMQNSAFKMANALTLNQPTAFGISANTTTLNGGVGGLGALNKNGAGTLVLTGTNTYSGGTTINNGSLQLGDGVNNGVVAGSINNNSPMVGGLTFDNGSSQTNTALISGPGSVAKTGNGMLTWGVQGVYTGSTVINAGTVISPINGLGANWAPVTVSSNATWTLNFGMSMNVGTLTLTNGNCGTGRYGNLNFTNVVSSGTSGLGVSEMKFGTDQAGGNYTGLLNVSDGTLTLNINGLYNYTTTATGSVVKAGGGTLLIANLGTSYKGSTTISGGILQASLLANGGTDSHIGQSSSAAANLVLNGGTLKYTGALVSCDRLFSLGINGGTLDASGSGAVTFANPGAIGFVDSGAHSLTLAGTSTAANTLAAAIGNNGGATALVKAGTDSWVVTGTNTFSGGTTVSNGSLTASAAGSLGAGNVMVVSGATCVIQNSNAMANGAYVYLNGVMNVAGGVTNTVQRLYISGVLQPSGIWNAARNATHFAGTGSLNVTTGSAPGPVALKAVLLSNSQVQVSWTTNDGGAFKTYYTPDLTPSAVWTPATNAPVMTGSQWTVTLPVSTNNHGFYRLQQ
jgi:autotransporter-associated beta strand protein